jgi:hypothetical protein
VLNILCRTRPKLGHQMLLHNLRRYHETPSSGSSPRSYGPRIEHGTMSDCNWRPPLVKHKVNFVAKQTVRVASSASWKITVLGPLKPAFGVASRIFVKKPIAPLPPNKIGSITV